MKKFTDFADENVGTGEVSNDGRIDLKKQLPPRPVSFLLGSWAAPSQNKKSWSRGGM